MKNNLIKDGIALQKCVTTNPRLHYFNAEYNDIDFKLFSDIQRPTKENLSNYRNSQKERVEADVKRLSLINNQLMETRKNISLERQEIAELEKKKINLIEDRKRIEQSGIEHQTNLEQKMEEASKTLDLKKSRFFSSV